MPFSIQTRTDCCFDFPPEVSMTEERDAVIR
jgi:hypothetical protein